METRCCRRRRDDGKATSLLSLASTCLHLDTAAQTQNVRRDCGAAGGHAAAGNGESVSSFLEAGVPAKLWVASKRERSASYEVNRAYTPVEVFITERCA